MNEQKFIIKQIDAIDSSDDFSAEKTYRVTIKKEPSTGTTDSYDGFDPEPLLWLGFIIIYIITSIVTLNPILAIFITPFIMIPVAFGGLALWVIGVILYGIISIGRNWHQARLERQRRKITEEKTQKQEYLASRAKYYATVAAEKKRSVQVDELTTIPNTYTERIGLPKAAVDAQTKPMSKLDIIWGVVFILYLLCNLIIWTKQFHSLFDGLIATIIMAVAAVVVIFTCVAVCLTIRTIILFIYRHTIAKC